MRLPLAVARRFIAGTIWLSLTCGACLAAPSSPPPAPETIGVNARIHVLVVEHPDDSGDYTVDPSGNITMLYVNQVHLVGLTLKQAANRIAYAYTKFYHLPHVTVTQIEPSGISVMVSGAVAFSGSRRLGWRTHLSDVLASAKPTQNADLSQVKIWGGGPPLVVNVRAGRGRTDAPNDPSLRDGDVVSVPALK